jgi:hypothetical protein
MDKTTTITEGQSLMDVAIQEHGTVETLFDLADANGLAITDALEAGQVMVVPSEGRAVVAIAAYFRSKAIRINTSSDTDLLPPATAQHDWSNPDFDTSDFDA